MVNITPRPLYPRQGDRASVLQEAGWTPGPIWTGAENLSVTGIRSPDDRLVYRTDTWSLVAFVFFIIWIGVPVQFFAPWKYCSQCGLLYESPSSKRSYSGRQVPLASTTRSSPLAARGGTMGEKLCLGYAPRVLLHAANLRHGTENFTSLPKEGMLRIFYRPLKIQWLRPGLNPRTWVSEASTLPLHHQSRCVITYREHSFVLNIWWLTENVYKTVSSIAVWVLET